MCKHSTKLKKYKNYYKAEALKMRLIKILLLAAQNHRATPDLQGKELLA